MARLASLSHTELFVDPSPRRLADDFRAHAREAFEMVLDDLAQRVEGPLVIAEGPSLLPELVAPVAASPEHTLFLSPTSEFTERNLEGRIDLRRGSPEFEQRHGKRLERDRLLTESMRTAATEHGLPVLDVDGSSTLEQTASRLTEHFAAALASGRGARDGAERSRLRQAENTELHTGVSMYLESLGADAPAEPPPVQFACECETLGCDARVSLSPLEYPRVGNLSAH